MFLSDQQQTRPAAGVL